MISLTYMFPGERQNFKDLNNVKLYLPVIKIGPRERHIRMCQHSMEEDCQLPRMKREDENFSKNSALHLLWCFHLENLKIFD